MNLRQSVEELDKKYHDRKVVLVDEQDNEIKIAGLIEAHRFKGLNHRAFSLQLYRRIDGQVQLLLQRRARAKPVFPFLWANTCCYNMAPDESYLPRAKTRVLEEMGIELGDTKLDILYKFSYYAPDVEDWCENELDSVIVGEWDGKVEINPEEAVEYRWISWRDLKKDKEKNPQIYAPWFKLMVDDSRFVNFFE